MKLLTEIWTIILLKCRIIDLLSLQLSCKLFNKIINSKYFRDYYNNKNMTNDELINYFINNQKKDIEFGWAYAKKIGTIFIVYDEYMYKNNYILPSLYEDNHYIDYPLENEYIWPLKVVKYETKRCRCNGEEEYIWTVKRLYSNTKEFRIIHNDGTVCISDGFLPINLKLLK